MTCVTRMTRMTCTITDDPRRLVGPALAAALRDSRARTWQVVGDLTPAQWQPPRQPGVNPIAWELAHLAWFAEFWMLRGPHTRAPSGHAVAHLPARIVEPDAHFDSARLAHADRWTTPMPTRAALEAMLAAQLEACIDALPGPDADDAAHGLARLVLFHEDLHAEAFCWLRAALGHAPPDDVQPPRVGLARQIALGGGEVEIGRRPGEAGFAFDNEMPGRTLRLEPFEIDAALVRCDAFARFVDAGGYDDPGFWPGAAGAWRAASNSAHPARWRRAPNGDWQVRWFDRWLPMDAASPVMHISAFEAEAWCRWAGRRLPTAAEWEHAAGGMGMGMGMGAGAGADAGFGAGAGSGSGATVTFEWGGSVWEWTADVFAPFPGFEPGPYCEYSAPWFGGDHRELRGGAFATHARLHDRRFRNFFPPRRTDIFAGFRSAAL